MNELAITILDDAPQTKIDKRHMSLSYVDANFETLDIS